MAATDEKATGRGILAHDGGWRQRVPGHRSLDWLRAQERGARLDLLGLRHGSEAHEQIPRLHGVALLREDLLDDRVAW